MKKKKEVKQVSPHSYFFSKKTRGQVWIETVIYTLIAMIMIGAVLSWGKPKIEQLQDKSIIEQTIGVFEDIDSQIASVIEGGAGNKRIVEIGLKKGSIKIWGDEDEDHDGNLISYEIETKYTYSEPGRDIYVGKIKIYTLKKGESNKVALTLNYDDVYDLVYNYDSANPTKDESKTITQSSTPYQLTITNTGSENVDGLPIISLEIN